jgi:hypothetical protein
MCRVPSAGYPRGNCASGRSSRLRRKARPIFSVGEPPVPESDTEMGFRTMPKLALAVYLQGLRECSSCGRGVALNRDGHYRRHYAIATDGARRLCVASSQKPPALPRW